ncbi:hypothetical protein MBLNU230_g2309t1 [Neophaeotheca triangularis]
MANSKEQPKSIVFVHPDLGIGGAERLVIDAAVAMQNLGHKVTVFTSYCDRGHCFEEARDGTLDVRVRGDRLFPPSLAGRFSILMSILRQLHLVLSIALFSSELAQLQPDVIFVDQLSACIPFFRVLYSRAKVLFYCHYPDHLLVQPEKDPLRKLLKSVYRLPFDALEGWSTGCADSVAVNSKYTRSVVRQTFTNLRQRELKVIYPCVDTSIAEDTTADKTPPLLPGRQVLLSINRFERKKNLALAIKAYAGLTASERAQATLILAGGHDPRNAENATTLRELQNLADTLSLTHSTLHNPTASSLPTSNPADILFLCSIPAQLKTHLLHSAALLLYTPTNEHFGIVPLEAMLARTPVLATNTGGPLETIYDGRTGWLRSPAALSAWTDVCRKPLIPSSRQGLLAMGDRGRERVVREFGVEKMGREIEGEVVRMGKLGVGGRPGVGGGFAVLGALGLGLGAVVAVVLGLVAGVWGR